MVVCINKKYFSLKIFYKETLKIYVKIDTCKLKNNQPQQQMNVSVWFGC